MRTRRRSFPGRAVILLLFVTAFVLTPLHAAASREYQLKAVFLFNFAQFVEWPEDAFAGPEAPLVIGLYGEDPFGGYLEEVVRGENIQGRPVTIRRFSPGEPIEGCHVLFVGRERSDQAREIVTRAGDHSVLTVGEDDRFTDIGGMIQFMMQNNRIRFRISLEAARDAGLSISSMLLRSAEIVGSTTP